MRHVLSSGLGRLLLVGALAGCSVGAETSGEEVTEGREAILNGAPATAAKYNAVGALVHVLPEFGVFEIFCSATLIAPEAVVTARHCTPSLEVDPELAQFGVYAAFAIGQNAYEPVEIVPITGYVNAPRAPGKDKGLLLDGGRDVAVAYLQNAPTAATPARLGLFQENMVGTGFEIAGFGFYNTTSLGLRHAGPVTARATKGRWYELLFNGNYQAYLSWYMTDSSATDLTEAGAKDWWKKYTLENKYELLAGGLPGEAVGCFGDSGGPLLRGSCAANLTVYGVSFATETTQSTLCGYGGGYLVFNRQMLDFVQGAL